MECMRDVNSTGITSGDSVDVSHVSEMPIIQQSIASAKGKKFFSLPRVITSSTTKHPVHEEDAGKNRRSKMLARRRILLEMLEQSDLILRKAVRLRECSKLLLEDFCKCTHDSPSETHGQVCECNKNVKSY